MAKMKHPNGEMRMKATGSDDTPSHHFANRIPDNATRKAHTTPRATTRHSSTGTSTEGRAKAAGCSTCNDSSVSY